MPNFFDLPRELRDQIYRFCVVDSKSVHTWTCSYQVAAGLLCVSKTVYREASSVFYSQNIFDFGSRHLDQVARFLDHIGPANAERIRHIIVPFPELRGLDLGHPFASLDNRLAILLAIVRGHCPRLRTITASHWYWHGLLPLCLIPYSSRPEAITIALTLVDSQFRVVPSVREIVVEAYDYGDPNDEIRREMARLGWTVSAGVKSTAYGLSLEEVNSARIRVQNEGRNCFCG
ncbi:hypothetical protein PG993_011624 [Apiospora rasikravindrae]|uniref:Uncharacterized protein n=1 Tax=Apiospora rasikravindrae TaxID=990691 RepID=A0ABR1S0L3_9PEZI